MKSYLTLHGFGRELFFDDNGLVAPGDGNGLDLLPVDNDQEIQNAARARHLASRRAYQKYSATELTLSREEWEQIADNESDTDTDSDSVGDAIFTCEGEGRAMDKLDYIGLAVEAVETHPLVTKFGFAPDSLITDVGGDHPVAMGFEVLSVTLAACQAADELADLAGKAEVIKVLGWTGKMPSALKGFGADRLFRSAGALQAHVRELRSPRFAPRSVAPVQTTDRKVGGIRARSNIVPAPATTASQNKAPPALPTQKPEGADWLGRIKTGAGLAYRCTCGCGVPVLENVAVVPPFQVMRDRQGSRVSANDMWRHAFAPRCIRIWGAWFSLVETQRRAFKAQGERVQHEARPQFAPRPPAPGQPGSGIGRPGKTAREKAKKRGGGSDLTSR